MGGMTVEDQFGFREHEEKINPSSHPSGLRFDVMKQISPADDFPPSPAAIFTHIENTFI